MRKYSRRVKRINKVYQCAWSENKETLFLYISFFPLYIFFHSNYKEIKLNELHPHNSSDLKFMWYMFKYTSYE